MSFHGVMVPAVNLPLSSVPLCVSFFTHAVDFCPSLPHKLSHVFIFGVLRLTRDQTHFPLLPGISGFRWLLALWASSGPFFSQLVCCQDSVFGTCRYTFVHTHSDLPGFGFPHVTDCVGIFILFLLSTVCLNSAVTPGVFIFSCVKNIAEDANCQAVSGRTWFVFQADCSDDKNQSLYFNRRCEEEHGALCLSLL